MRCFLAAAGFEGAAPDDLVATYVDLVGAAGRPGLPRHRLSIHLTAQSPRWAAPDVETLEEAWRAQQQARAGDAATARDAADQDGPGAQAYVAGGVGTPRDGLDVDRA